MFEKIKNIFLKLIELALSEDEEKVAKGLAVGIFIGTIPVVGIHTISAILIASILGYNRLAAAIGTYIPTNPWTTIPLFILEYYVGRLILRILGIKLTYKSLHFTLKNPSQLLKLGKSIYIPMLIGGIFLAFIFAILGYYIFIYALKKTKIKKVKKLNMSHKQIKIVSTFEER